MVRATPCAPLPRMSRRPSEGRPGTVGPAVPRRARVMAVALGTPEPRPQRWPGTVPSGIANTIQRWRLPLRRRPIRPSRPSSSGVAAALAGAGTPRNCPGGARTPAGRAAERRPWPAAATRGLVAPQVSPVLDAPAGTSPRRDYCSAPDPSLLLQTTLSYGGPPARPRRCGHSLPWKQALPAARGSAPPPPSVSVPAPACRPWKPGTGRALLSAPGRSSFSPRTQLALQWGLVSLGRQDGDVLKNLGLVESFGLFI